MLANLLKNKSTLLSIGPVSKNCVDATIEISDKHNLTLTLIASRNQIDNLKFNGGYVNNWHTASFAKYVRKKCKNKKIYLARDQGGPWQNNLEVQKKMSLKDAMLSAKDSLKTDIDSGFDFIHLDPSIDIHQNLDQKNVIKRLFDLIAFCNDYSKKKNKKIFYEVGTEEQSGSTVDFKQFEHNIKIIFDFCDKNKFDRPIFIVAQTGTKVMEMKNIGAFDSPLRFQKELPVEIQVPKIIEICNRNNILLKEHNADYLSIPSLKWHTKLGIHSVNVAPEFGVVESKAFVEILLNNNLNKLCEEFLKLSYNSKKWKKWMLKNTNSTDFEKAIIAGHYIFSTEEFIEIKKIALKKIINLDYFLKQKIKECIYKYLYAFNSI